MKSYILFLTLISTLQLCGQKADTLRIEHHYYYLTDIDSRTIARRFMNNELQPSDNLITFRILDSLTSFNVDTRKYYLPVFNKILRQSDGALSEVIGTTIIDFLKQYPAEFAMTIKSKELFELYSNFAAYELHFSEDYMSDLSDIEQLTSDNNTSYQDTELIKNFLKQTFKKVEVIWK